MSISSPVILPVENTACCHESDNKAATSYKQEDFSSFFQPPLAWQDEPRHLDKFLDELFADALEQATREEKQSSHSANTGINILDNDENGLGIISGDSAYSPSSSSRNIKTDSRQEDLLEWQRQQLIDLRSKLRERDYEIRSLKIEVAAKTTEISYLPDLLDKALKSESLQNQIDGLEIELLNEKARHEKCQEALAVSILKIDRLSQSLVNRLWQILINFGKSLGFKAS